MATTPIRLMHHLRRIAIPREPEVDADAVLLNRFVHRRDETAFAALVARHGPMVLHTCRRLVGDAHAAEDCFQAVWIVLARRAGAIGRPAALAGWLYGVARRVALRARHTHTHNGRPQRFPDDAEPADPRPDPLSELTARDLLTALDEELQRLPEMDRLAIVLCCLEGLSQAEAAKRLGCTAGSVKGRLERGRKKLHARLARRGLELPVVLSAAEVTRGLATAEVSVALMDTTVQAALFGVLRNTAVAGTIPAPSAALAEGVLRTLLLIRVKTAVALLLMFAVIGLGAIGVVCQWTALGQESGENAALARPEQAAPIQGQAPKAAPLHGQIAAQKKGGVKDTARTPADLIRAAITRAGGGESYPILPNPSTPMRGHLANEILGAVAIRTAYTKLDATKERNVTWFEGVKELEQQKAVWCLASCLCHPSSDVQIHALRSLKRLGDKRAVPFLLLYAEYMAVLVGGSENATIHGILHTEIAQTLSALTGLRVDLRGQDPEGLERGVRLWRRWLVDREK